MAPTKNCMQWPIGVKMRWKNKDAKYRIARPTATAAVTKPDPIAHRTLAIHRQRLVTQTATPRPMHLTQVAIGSKMHVYIPWAVASTQRTMAPAKNCMQWPIGVKMRWKNKDAKYRIARPTATF